MAMSIQSTVHLRLPHVVQPILSEAETTRMTMVMIVDEIDEAYSSGSRNHTDDDGDDDDGVCNDDERRGVHPHNCFVLLDKCQQLAWKICRGCRGCRCCPTHQ